MEELEKQETANTTAEKKKNGTDYKSLSEMKQTLQGYRDQALGAVYLSCDQTGLSRKLTEEALRNTEKINIENSSDDTLKEFLNSIKTINGENDYYDGEEGLTRFKDMILNLKDLIDQVIECETQLHKINEAIREVEISITSEIFSEKYINAKLKEVDVLETNIRHKLDNNEYSTVEEIVAARRDLRNCDELRKIYDLSFVTDKIDYDKLIDTFMRRMSNDYCFKKCSVTMDKMGLSMAALNSFANLEEQYLDEKYHPFNNFFLFHVIRLMSYLDPENKMNVLKAKTLIHGLVGYVSAPEECKYIGSLIERFYDPLFKKIENNDPNALRLLEANPYTNENSTEIDEKIVEDVNKDNKDRAVKYIKSMILVDGSVSSEEDVDVWINNASYENILEMSEKISLLIKLGRFCPTSMSIVGVSFISLDELKKDYDKMNEAYEKSTHIEN